MSFDFGWHPHLLAAAFLIGLLLTLWTYRRSVPQIGKGLRRLLAALRATVLFLILLLLARPTLTRLSVLTQDPLTVVLLDNSQSTGLTEEESGLDVRAHILGVIDGIGHAGLPGTVQYYGFAADVSDWGQNGGVIQDSLRSNGIRTDISHALQETKRRHQSDNLRAVVLVSDGRFNAGRNPAYTAEEGSTPVFTIVVGDTTARRDVQIRSVVTNDLAYQGQELPVQVRVQATEYDGQRARVVLMEGSETLDSESLNLPASGSERIVDLAFTPLSPGLKNLSARITRFDGELTYSNNVETFTVRVLDNLQRILLVSAGATPDLAAVRKLLSEDDNLEVVSRTQRAVGQFYEGPLPEDLASFSAIVLAGYPGSGADVDSARKLAQASLSGTPLCFLLDRGTDLNTLKSLFSDVLPVQLTAIRPGFVEADLEPTPEGNIHPILSSSENVPSAWRSLPPLLYNESLWRASTDAKTLATVRIRNLSLGDPLLVVRSRSGNRSAALLGVGTWRWQNLPADLSDFETVWPDLFSNLVRWLSAREDDRPVRIQPSTDLFDGQQPVEFTGQVYDESLEPISEALVQIRVVSPDGSLRIFTMDPLGNGRYTLNAGQLPEGTYSYIAAATQSGQAIGEDQGAFAVGETAIEFKELQADAPTMRQIAIRSGGQSFTVGTLEALRSAMSGDLAPRQVSQQTQMRLWHLPIILLCVLMLLAAEWIIRKRAGMV